MATSEEEDIHSVFAVGDAAGVFAVLNGAVVPTLSNLRLSYSVNGSWLPAEDVAFTDDLKNADFYAYYPYDENAVFLPAEADPFTQMVSTFPVRADQSAWAGFTASDLMTSNATRLTAYNTIELKLQHRFAMAMIELPNASYLFTNPGIDLYVRSSADSASFTLDGQAVQPFFDETSQTFRLIIRTGTTGELAVHFVGNVGQKTAHITNLSLIPAGQYARYVVDGGVQFTTTTLQIGDFFCLDGSIISKDSTAEILTRKNDIIAVVYQIGTTDAICADQPTCKHALAIDIREGKGKWSTKGSTSSDENNAGWKSWWTDYGLQALSTTSAASIDLAELLPTGYEYTAAWLSIDTALTLGGYKVPVKDAFQAYYDTYAMQYPLPATASMRFVPSLREWLDIKSVEPQLTAAFAAIDATPFSWDGTGADKVYYWSSCIRSSVAMWTYTGAPLDAAPATLFHADTKDSRIYRFILAF